MKSFTYAAVAGLAFALSTTLPGPASAQEPGGPGCDAIADALENDVRAELSNALATALGQGPVGLDNDMWATIVDTNGIVCAVVTSGGGAGNQWLGSRVISAQKANTGNAFSLNSTARGTPIALSSANLWFATQPGGSLFGLQFSNPVDPAVAYGDNMAGSDSLGADTSQDPGYGGAPDPLVGHYIGGINVFGGGLALYGAGETLLGGLGLSGDTSCADHVKAWRTRDVLALDNIPGGVSPTGDDNIIFDLESTNPGNSQSGFDHLTSPSGFGHPTCGFGEAPIAEALPETHPIGNP